MSAKVDSAMAEVNGATSGRPLRLVVRDLPDDDLARIAGVLRAVCAPGRRAWTLGFSGAADLVLWSGHTSDPRADAPAAPRVRVTGPHGPIGPGPSLRRPIDAAALTELLDAVASGRPLEAAPPAPGVSGGLPRDARFRLRRWPPGSLLEPPYRRKLADHLLMHDADMLGLARSCRVPLLRCCEFVSELQRAGLLLVDGRPAQPATPAAWRGG